jgi:hypothetical protein
MTALFILVSVVPVHAGPQPSGSRSKVIQRGAPIASEAKMVTITQVRESPDAYAKDPVVVEGVVSEACWIRGCWMTLSSETGESHIHVTFNGFTVPRNSKGWKARVMGVAKARIENGKSHVWFVASGVELKD